MDRERIMLKWDEWRAAIADGCRASWPRDEFESLIDAIAEDEREACAKLADAHFIFGHSVAGPHFAAALADKIRARSNAEVTGA